MLYQDDLQLIERDRHVPGLAVVLDPESLAAALRDRLPDAGVVALEPVYVHYKPYTNCIVAGRLRTESSEFLVYAKAYGSDAPIKFEKTRMLQEVTSPLGPGTLILEDSNIGFYFFPVDHRLKGLRRLASEDAKRGLIRELLGKSREYPCATLRHLRYKPERRYVACLETDEVPKALLKFYVPRLYRAAKAASQAFTTTDSSSARHLLGFSDRHNVLAFEWLHGQPLSQTILDADIPVKDRADAVELTGSALGQMHAQAPANLTSGKRADEIRRLAAQAATIAHLCPALGEYAEDLARQLGSLLDSIGDDKTASHGDFYDRQVLLAEGRPVILDLDEAGYGHPAMDPGLFVAHLERHAVYNRMSPSDVEQYTDRLVRGYQIIRPAPSDSSIRLYAAIGLFHLAAEPFRYREQNWREQLEKLLNRVEALMNGAVGAHRGDPASAACG